MFYRRWITLYGCSSLWHLRVRLGSLFLKIHNSKIVCSDCNSVWKSLLGPRGCGSYTAGGSGGRNSCTRPARGGQVLPHQRQAQHNEPLPRHPPFFFLLVQKQLRKSVPLYYSMVLPTCESWVREENIDGRGSHFFQLLWIRFQFVSGFSIFGQCGSGSRVLMT